MEFFTKVLDTEHVHAWFDWVNNGSVFYVIVPFFVIELTRYAVLNRLNWNVVGDSLANVITLFAFITIEFILGALFLYKVYFWVYENMSLPHLPLNMVTILCCILLADFAYYWDHRVMHRIGIGWATHTVHHSSPHFNMSVAYRFGPLDAVFPVIFSLPIVMLGFNPWLLLAAELFVQTYQAILHTEIIGKLPRPIEYLMNTPSHHRVHHGSNDKYLDKNYAGILIIWDRMFGSFAEEKEEVVYGITEPLESVNPFKVFFHGFTRLYRMMKSTKGFKNKLSYLIKPPGWTPD
ncbi:sterol desaturase family protein [Fulvivirgaceae bacterium BMA10]|uniref:Sterol desaturase family protein n=1 Tax=Splendidivirga corallicola TaxID=3051826 RepID=A0ABT8KS29_9BACT|nr:sterol desaturase family protein [Fulvivirgaceae bacterium BMA10]